MKLKSILKGAGLSLGCLALGLLGGAWWVLAVWEPEMNLSGYLQLIYLLAVWVGGMTAGYGAGSLPWRHGGVTGAITCSVLLVLQWLLVPTFYSWAPALKLLGTGVIMGSFAGVVGQNLRRAAKRRQQVRKVVGFQKF